MKLFSNEHLFSHPWSKVSAANWIKYPNELTPHVLHVDYLSRSVDPRTGILRTVRLLSCKQNVPDIILKLLGGSSEAYVYEVSEVDPQRQTLTMKTRNLTMANVMTIEEECQYSPCTDNPTNTLLRQEARITSLNCVSYISNKIEEFCLERFHANASRGRAALETVLDKLVQETKELFMDSKDLYEGTKDVLSAAVQNKVHAESIPLQTPLDSS